MQCLVDEGWFDIEVEADGDGSQHVIDVIGADELCLYGERLGVALFLVVDMPAEAEEGVAGEHLALDDDIVGRACAVGRL